MPEIDFSTEIRDPLKGEPIHSADLGGPLTLGAMVYVSAMGNLRGDEGIDPAKKLAVGALAIRVAAGGLHSLKAEEIAVLKDRLTKAYAPVLACLGCDILDPG